MKSSKVKLKCSVDLDKPTNFDNNFWNKFEQQNTAKKINWLLPMGLVLSCFLMVFISFNIQDRAVNLTYDDFDSYIDMQFELDIEDELVTEVNFDDEILFE